MSKGLLVEKLVELLETEHPSCDDNTCLINADMLETYPIHIGECFASSGAASRVFEKTYSALCGRYKNADQHSRLEASKICKSIPHMTCVRCNAVIWDQSGTYFENDPVRCASCGAVSHFKSEKE